MIPNLIDIPDAPFRVLPEGIHPATLMEIQETFAYNSKRRDLFEGLVRAVTNLKSAGCSLIFLDGSYVTEKPNPGDFDGVWHPAGVSKTNLDPVFLDFDNGRQAQKKKYKGEFFPDTRFVDFFQIEKFTGETKGILSIDISVDDYLRGVNSNDI